MAESEWLPLAEPQRILDGLRSVSERKLRLAGCACCREALESSSDDRLESVIETSEQFADGLVTSGTLNASHSLATDILETIQSDASEQRWHYVQEYAAVAAFQVCRSDLNQIVLMEVIRHSATASVFASDEEEATVWRRQDGILVAYIRDIFGDPLRPGSINPVWLTPTVTSLAQAAYDERIMPAGEMDLARLAILSDALEEVGCDDADLLEHLRSPGPHVRGCWAVDLVFGKE